MRGRRLSVCAIYVRIIIRIRLSASMLRKTVLACFEF